MHLLLKSKRILNTHFYCMSAFRWCFEFELGFFNDSQTPSVQRNNVTPENSMCVGVYSEAFSTSLPLCKIIRAVDP